MRNVTQTTMRFKKYCAQKIIPWFSPDIYDKHFIERIRCELVNRMLYAVKENIIFDFVKDDMGRRVIATLYLGRKDDLDDESEG